MKKAEKQDAEVFQAVVDTPKGSRNKYKYDDKRKQFKLGGVLAAGLVFPFDFGYLPQTRGEDGDALDVLILMDEPAFVGCVIEIHIIGVIEAEQTEGEKTFRNDRLIAIAIESHRYQDIRELSEIDAHLLDEIEHFFISYNQIKGKQFKPLSRSDSAGARALIEKGRETYRQKPE